MTIGDFVRQQTLGVRDAIRQLDERLTRAEGQRQAAEERVRRAGTEITKQRTLKGERKRSATEAAEKVSEARRALEEIERKRQEAHEALIRYQEEQKAADRELAEAQSATEAALIEIRREQAAQQEAEAFLVRTRKEIEEQQSLQSRLALKALDSYLEQLRQRVHDSFATQEEQSNAMREYEAFRKARHEDPEIGAFCEQRDELKKLLSSAMVPAVKSILQASLSGIESQIAQHFPGVFQEPRAISRDNPIEEMPYYCNQDGKATVFLPIRESDWITAANLTGDSPEAMCIVWSMIKDMNLRLENGDFIVINGRPVYASKFDLEEIAILQGFSVKRGNQEVIRFVLSSVPAEVQEILSNEG